MERHEKFVIGWTDWGQMCGETAFKIVELVMKDRRSRDLCNGVIRAGGAYIDDIHNDLTADYLKTFTAENTPWFFSLDADMVPEPWQFYALLDAADPIERPIVSANYFGYMKTRLDSGGLASVWMKHYKDGYRTIEPIDLIGQTHPEFPDLVEIDSSGMGFMLIHRSVFEKIAEMPNFEMQQWFGRTIIREGDEAVGRYGEDVAFCRRAQMAGLKIYGHGAVVIDHVKTRKENIASFVERVEGRSQIRSRPEYAALRQKLGPIPNTDQYSITQEHINGAVTG